MKKVFTPQLTEKFTAKKTLLFLIAAAVIIAIGAYAWKLQSTPTVNQVAETETIDAVPGELLTLEKVEEIASSRSGNDTAAQIATIELEDEHGTLVYKIRMTNGRMLFINAQTGANAAHHYENRAREQATDDTLTLPANFAPGISFTEARDIALAKNPNTSVERIKFETEHGIIVYSVRFTDDSRVDINASNGEIVRTKDIGSDKNDSSGSGSGRDDSNDDSSRSGSDDRGFDDSSSRRGSDD
ncbi:MAG TPA: PepSY domain-containing protein [Candidatus Saccharimonadales bacterium]|nr:PepSY domain-containing protein [Candidatus Saccharimonadales bacterium]